MARRDIEIFACLSLLFFSNCLAAPRPNVLDAILDTLRNIEDLIRGISESPLYLTSSIGRNGIVHSPQLLRSRDVVLNVDPFEQDDIREFLNLESRGSRSASSNSNSNSNIIGMEGLSDNKIKPNRPIFRNLPKLRRKPRIQEIPMSDDGNSNSNSNVNSNSNINSNAINLASKNHPKYGLKVKSGRNSYGARSLSRSRVKDLNQNVNTNVNTNTMDALDDEEFDYEN